MARAVNLNREAYDVYIGRAGKGQDGYFGNPIPLMDYRNYTERTRVIEQYADYFSNRIATDVEFVNRILALRGKRLGCFCKPLPCHGDMIALWIENATCSKCKNPATVAINSLPHVKMLCHNCKGD